MSNVLDVSTIDNSIIEKINNLALMYLDTTSNFEESVQDFIEDTYSQYKIKSSVIKFLIKLMIEIFMKKSDNNSISNDLSQYNFSNDQINNILSLKKVNVKKIEGVKLISKNKLVFGRINQFKTSFYIKYADSNSTNVNFTVKLLINYVNDENKEVKYEFEMGLSQFYQLFNQMNKIDSIIKTLI